MKSVIVIIYYLSLLLLLLRLQTLLYFILLLLLLILLVLMHAKNRLYRRPPDTAQSRCCLMQYITLNCTQDNTSHLTNKYLIKTAIAIIQKLGAEQSTFEGEGGVGGGRF